MTKAFLEITLKIAPENRAQAGGVYKKYRQPFLSDTAGAESKGCERIDLQCEIIEELSQQHDQSIPDFFKPAGNFAARHSRRVCE